MRSALALVAAAIAAPDDGVVVHRLAGGRHVRPARPDGGGRSVALAVVAAAAGGWRSGAARSPAGSTLMDAEWLAALGEKDYCFRWRGR